MNEKFCKIRKKGAPSKQSDKSPEDQLPSSNVDVPAFLAEMIKLSAETQAMGKELFETFSKNSPGIWAAQVPPGIEIEDSELSDSPDERVVLLLVVV
eukprot:2536536-Rhodomonas_salina.4